MALALREKRKYEEAKAKYEEAIVNYDAQMMLADSYQKQIEEFVTVQSNLTYVDSNRNFPMPGVLYGAQLRIERSKDGTVTDCRMVITLINESENDYLFWGVTCNKLNFINPVTFADVKPETTFWWGKLIELAEDDVVEEPYMFTLKAKSRLTISAPSYILSYKSNGEQSHRADSKLFQYPGDKPAMFGYRLIYNYRILNENGYMPRLTTMVDVGTKSMQGIILPTTTGQDDWTMYRPDGSRPDLDNVE